MHPRIISRVFTILITSDGICFALSCKFTLAYPCRRPQRPPANTAGVCIQPRRDPKKRSKLQASDDDMDSDNPADDDEEEETERSSVGGKGK